jgi:hypothetical protein
MYRYALRQERIVLIKYERAAFLIPCQGLRGYFAKFQFTSGAYSPKPLPRIP